ncbi:MAG TPA: LapA family protein [Lacipirellulaceae bacterium]|jgi:hypothetical protein|nr:LapA family protein [Lacipirellulaceae bacterium]
MSNASPESPMLSRARFSLATILIAFLIIGLALVVVLQRWQIGPLRRELRAMREQLGSLTINDVSRVYAIQVRQPDPNLWRWRIYLPSGHDYCIREVEGTLPSRMGKQDKDWLEEVKNAQYGVGRGEYSGSELNGELNIEASLFDTGKSWRFCVRPGNNVTELPPSFIGDWLGDISRIESSATSKDAQMEFDPREPIILLHLEQPVLKPITGGGTQSTESATPTHGIVIWLERQ